MSNEMILNTYLIVRSTFFDWAPILELQYYLTVRSPQNRPFFSHRTIQAIAVIFCFYGMLLSLTVSEIENRRVDSAFHGQSHLVNNASIVID